MFHSKGGNVISSEIMYKILFNVLGPFLLLNHFSGHSPV